MTDNYIRKVEALINRANHKDANSEERIACLAKADEIMAKHRLDRAMLFKDGNKPEKEIIVKTVSALPYSPYVGSLTWMRKDILTHCGVMSRTWQEEVTLVGYEEDIFYAEMLWTSVYMEFTSKLFPKWESHRGFDANVYALKNAGYSWPEVRDFALAENAGDHISKLTVKNAGSKLRTAFKREAQRNGIEVLPGRQQPANSRAWRDSFVEGFVNTLYGRLAVLSAKAKEAAGEAGEIALISDADRVKHRFWEMYPETHPEAIRRVIEENRASFDRAESEMTEAEKKKLERDQKAAARRWTREQDRKMNSSSYQHGYSTGRDTARSLNLGRESAVSDRQNAKELS